MKTKTPGFNFVHDHMTLLVDHSMYKLMYAFLRIVMGIGKDALIYEKRRRWDGSPSETSMTYAVATGDIAREKNAKLGRTMIAVVQPSEPQGRSSHVREMLARRSTSVHWQHLALRTPDLIGFYRHALAHAVNFITPIMKDGEEDLLQVFTGELYPPGGGPSAVFFEFVQRDVTSGLLRRIKAMDRESFFRDRTFLGLYGEKEREYQGSSVTPIWDHALMRRILELWNGREVWQITDQDLERAKTLMKDYAKRRKASGKGSALVAA